MSRPSPSVSTGSSPPRDEIPRQLREALAAALRGMRFGSVEITVHDAAVVQIERRERLRLAGDGGRA